MELGLSVTFKLELPNIIHNPYRLESFRTFCQNEINVHFFGTSKRLNESTRAFIKPLYHEDREFLALVQERAVNG